MGGLVDRLGTKKGKRELTSFLLFTSRLGGPIPRVLRTAHPEIFYVVADRRGFFIVVCNESGV